MKIAVFGGSGKTGQLFIKAALEAGHTVRALVRPPAARDGLSELSAHWIEGNAQDGDAVRATLEDQDCAISFLGNFNRKPNTEVSDASKNVLKGLADAGIKRFVVISTIGTGDSFKPMKSLPFKLIIKTVARNIWIDRERQEALVKASTSDWTIIRPAGLRDEGDPSAYQISPSNGPFPKVLTIPRAAVAAFGLAALGDATLIGKTVCQFS